MLEVLAGRVVFRLRWLPGSKSARTYDDGRVIESLVRRNAFDLCPSQETLDKYGLTSLEWQAMFVAQDGKCPMCKWWLIRSDVAYPCTDHEHVAGYETMPPEQRKLYVRGILCGICSQYLGRTGDGLDEGRRSHFQIWAYLRAYRDRRPSDPLAIVPKWDREGAA